MTFKSSLSAVLKALRGALVRSGVNVGGTASYPRVEIHSLQEQAPETKDDSVREVSCTIECISEERIADVMKMASDNTGLILGAAGLSMDEFKVIGIIAGQTRMLDEQESVDQNKIIYRLMQDFTIWIERK